MRVYLSASTQENNIGIDGVTEEDRMYQLRDRAEYFIKNGGVKIDIGKNTNKSWGLAAIVNDSNNFGANLHLAFHSNAGNKKIRGCEAYYSHLNKNGTGKKIATLWYNQISKVTPTTDRGVMVDTVLYNSGLYELSKTNATAALMEFFFHTNSADVDFYKVNMDLFAMGTAMAVYDYFGYTFIPTNIKSYEAILKEVSNYSNVWIKFVKEHPEVNLKGLIQMLYYK